MRAYAGSMDHGIIPQRHRRGRRRSHLAVSPPFFFCSRAEDAPWSCAPDPLLTIGPVKILKRVRELLGYLDQLEPAVRAKVAHSYQYGLQAAFWFTAEAVRGDCGHRVLREGKAALAVVMVKSSGCTHAKSRWSHNYIVIDRGMPRVDISSLRGSLRLGPPYQPQISELILTTETAGWSVNLSKWPSLR